MEINRLLISYRRMERDASKIESFPFKIPVPRIRHKKSKSAFNIRKSMEARDQMQRVFSKKKRFQSKKKTKKKILFSLNQKLQQSQKNDKENKQDNSAKTSTFHDIKINNFMLDEPRKQKRKGASGRSRIDGSRHSKPNMSSKKFREMSRALEEQIEVMDEYSKSKVAKGLRQLGSLCHLKLKYHRFSFLTALNEIHMNIKIKCLELKDMSSDWQGDLDPPLEQRQSPGRESSRGRRGKREEADADIVHGREGQGASTEGASELDQVWKDKQHLSAEFDIYRLKQKSFNTLKRVYFGAQERRRSARALDARVEDCLRKLAAPKKTLLLSQMFEIKEDQDEYLSDESPTAGGRSSREKAEHWAKVRSKESIKLKLEREESLRQERLRRKFSKIEAIRRSRQEEKNRKMREEQETQKKLRKQIDDKIREKRRFKKQSELAKQEQRRRRREALAKAKLFRQGQLKSRLLAGAGQIAEMSRERVRRLEKRWADRTRKRCFEHLRERREVRRKNDELLVETFEWSVRNRLRVKAGFVNWAESVRISKAHDARVCSGFLEKSLKNRAFSRWKQNLKYLRTENFWIKEAEKETVKKFEKRRRLLIFEMVFSGLRRNRVNQKLEKEKKEYRREMRVKVDLWLKDFKPKQLR